MIIKGVIGGVLAFGLIAGAKDHVCLLYSQTNSLPYHYFLKLNQISPQKGNYTCFESAWYGGKVIKEIVGIEGDLVAYDTSGNLWIGPRIIGKPQKKAKDGRSLTPIKPGRIPEGFVFVKGVHERSFDSRYEELGLIPKRALQGRVLGLI
jgi:conjugal transfer pilin signal peptidase TrbI